MPIRASPSGMPNAKYLVFGTPKNKKPFSWNYLNVINFDTHKQYRCISETVQTNMLKKIFFNSFSVSSFMTFLSSLSYFFLLSFFACSLSFVTSSSLFLLLSSPASSPLLFFSFSFFPVSCVHFTTILFHTFSLNKNLVGVL